MTVICETERLIIRELTEDDAAFILELMNTDDWHRFIGDRGLKTIEDAKAQIREKHIAPYRNDGYGFWGVEEKASGELTGICGLAKRDEETPIDIGFGFLPRFYRKGYGYESSVAVLGYARSVLEIDPIIALTSGENIGSQNLLKKLGMHLQGKKVFKEEWGESWIYGFWLRPSKPIIFIPA